MVILGTQTGTSVPPKPDFMRSTDISVCVDNSR